MYLQLLLFSSLAFFLLLPLMKHTLTISLDTDWIWRKLMFRTGRAAYNAKSPGSWEQQASRYDSPCQFLFR